MVLEGFRHRPGVHCGSTALGDALRARGLDLSEPTVFGLGYTGRLWLEVDAPPRPRSLREAISDALARQARHMLDESGGQAGVSGLERFAEELPRWPERSAGEADIYEEVAALAP